MGSPSKFPDLEVELNLAKFRFVLSSEAFDFSPRRPGGVIPAKLRKKTSIDEVVQPPEFTQVNVQSRVHHLIRATDVHPNSHVGLIVPSFDRQ